jgi:hypothetical protein
MKEWNGEGWEGTVELVLTHTTRWTVHAMGYQGVWALGGRLKIQLKKFGKNPFN